MFVCIRAINEAEGIKSTMCTRMFNLVDRRQEVDGKVGIDICYVPI